MSNFIDFLKEFGWIIFDSLAILFSFLLVFLKKRPITEVIDEGLTARLLEFVNEAEVKFRCGSDKMNYVIQRFKEKYPLEYQKINEDSSSKFFSEPADSVIRNVVEFILSTPQKKVKS